VKATDDVVELLSRLASALAATDPEALVGGLCRVACELTEAELALFADASGANAPVVVGPAAVSETPDPTRAPLLAAALAAGEAMLIEDVTRFAADDLALRPYGSLADGRAVRSWVTAPVIGRDGALLGALIVGHADIRAFDTSHQRVLSVLADHLAGALSRARLAEERSHVAQALQETLLPPLLPRIAGVEVAARYRPSGAGNLVGGDFYDVFECGPGIWGVLLGDVSGVGPEAAALTGIARYTARAVATATAAPSEVLGAINRALANQRTEDRFCTAVYATLRPAGGLDPAPGAARALEVTIASGGHPGPLVVRDDGTIEDLELDPGVLLGPFEEARFDDARVCLSPGDALVLYTDGVTEARDRARELFGQARLQDVLAAAAGRTADGIARRVELAVSDYQAGGAADDVAVVVIRAAPG